MTRHATQFAGAVVALTLLATAVFVPVIGQAQTAKPAALLLAARSRALRWSRGATAATTAR